MAKSHRTKELFVPIMVKDSLKTRELAKECAALLGRDEADRKCPTWLVTHRAIVAYKAQLLAEKEQAAIKA